MCVICFYDTNILFYCIPLVYENKTYIYIYIIVGDVFITFLEQVIQLSVTQWFKMIRTKNAPVFPDPA